MNIFRDNGGDLPVGASRITDNLGSSVYLYPLSSGRYMDLMDEGWGICQGCGIYIVGTPAELMDGLMLHECREEEG